MSVYDEHVRWLWRRIAAESVPDLLVVGAVDAGKTTFFQEIAQRQPHIDKGVQYRYWDLLRTPKARTESGFYAELTKNLGLASEGPLSEHLDNLSGRLDKKFSSNDRIVLILDHWDQAQENYEACIDLESLEVLQQYVRNSQQNLLRHTTRLGLILVTRFPATDMFVGHVRGSNKPGLVRVSGDLGRLINHIARFPFLGRAQTLEMLKALGCANSAERIADVCGGWIGLLVAASRVATGQEIERDRLVRMLADDVGLMLEKSLLPAVAARHKLNFREAWDHILRDIEKGGDPTAKYALPTTSIGQQGGAGLQRLPPALREYLRPAAILLVDLERITAVIGDSTMPKGDREHVVSDAIEAMRIHFGIDGDRVLTWVASDGRYRGQDIRTPMIVFSDRPTLLIADPGPSANVLVVVDMRHPLRRAENMPSAWRVLEYDLGLGG